MRVEEYIVLRDDSSTLRLAKLDCHSVYNGKAILRFPGTVEEYEVASIHTYQGKHKLIVEYELGRCVKCIKLEPIMEVVV